MITTTVEALIMTQCFLTIPFSFTVSKLLLIATLATLSGCKTTHKNSAKAKDNRDTTLSTDGWIALPNDGEGELVPLTPVSMEDGDGLASFQSPPAARGTMLDDDADPVDQCHCPTGRVSCSGPTNPGAGANARRSTCQIFMAAPQCQILKYNEGSTLSSISILDWTPPQTGNAVEAVEYCGFKHEVRHLCDDTTVSQCQTETNAFAVSCQCMQDYFNKNCTGNPNTPFCQTLARNQNTHAASGYLNKCHCAGGTMQNCLNECFSKWRGPECLTAARLYYW